jgi:hypothetical protein
MANRPSREDLERKLAEVSRECLPQAIAEGMKVDARHFFPNGGLRRYSDDQVADMIDTVHADAMKLVIDTMETFLKQERLVPNQIAAWALPSLQRMTKSIVANAPPATRSRCAQSCDARLDGLLRDVAIGLHGGSRSDEIFSLKPGAWGFNVNLKALWHWFLNLFKGI